jgi:hypothetical protein
VRRMLVVLLLVAGCTAPAAAAHHKPNHHKPGHGGPTTTTTVPTTTTTTPPTGCGGTMAVTVARAQTTSTAGPITITQGGTYAGFYRSDNPAVPAVTVQTTELVELDHACIEHAGLGIYASWTNAKLYVHDSTFQKLPTAGGAAFPGHRAIYAYAVTTLNVDNNLFIDGDGVYWQAETVSPTQGRFNRNVVVNVGRYLPDSLVNAFQTNKVTVGGLEVAWNKVTNTPLQSDIEDTFNFFESNGTSGAPFDVHHNLIDGGFPPTLGPGNYNGVGVVLGDDLGSYQRAHHNTIVQYVNAGVSIPAGTNLELDNNVVVNSGLINGVATGPDYGNGLTFWDGLEPGVPTNSSVHDNVVGYMRLDGTLVRSDYFTPRCGLDGNTCSNNTSMSGTIDAADEQAARDDWEAARVAAGVTIGPR